jgi:hypothetical protein
LADRLPLTYAGRRAESDGSRVEPRFPRAVRRPALPFARRRSERREDRKESRASESPPEESIQKDRAASDSNRAGCSQAAAGPFLPFGSQKAFERKLEQVRQKESARLERKTAARRASWEKQQNHLAWLSDLRPLTPEQREGEWLRQERIGRWGDAWRTRSSHYVAKLTPTLFYGEELSPEQKARLAEGMKKRPVPVLFPSIFLPLGAWPSLLVEILGREVLLHPAVEEAIVCVPATRVVALALRDLDAIAKAAGPYSVSSREERERTKDATA